MRSETAGVVAWRIWTSRILTALPALFLLMDRGMKLFKPPLVVDATTRLGYPESATVGYRRCAGGLHRLVSDTAHNSSGCDFAHWLSWRSRREHCPGRTPLFNAVFPVFFAVMVWASWSSGTNASNPFS